MQEEIWKDAKVLKNGELFDFTGLYEASNLGRIRNAKTGQIFNSIKEACDWLDIDYRKLGSNITKCCRGIYKTVGGYHWQYVD